MSRLATVVVALSIAMATPNVFGQAPDSVSFQGRLTDAVGDAIDASGLSMTFALYKGATKVWEETQSVDVIDGIFNVLLGAVTPLDTVRFNTPIDLGVKVGADAEMTPRTPLASAAYAKALPGLYTFYHDNGTYKSHNVVGGAPNNEIGSGVTGATIGGGGGSSMFSSFRNRVSADFGTVVGGGANAAGSPFSFVGGGINNRTNQFHAVVVGGSNNLASGLGSVVGGGDINTAGGSLATVPGGSRNRATGDYSFAAGHKARALHEGSFVWDDRSSISGNDSLESTASNQFIIRAVNGFGINQAPVGQGVHLKQVGASASYGIRTEYSVDTDYWDTYIDNADDYNFAYNNVLKSWIDDTDGAYVQGSDASLKEDVRPHDDVLQGVLQLRLSTYRFKGASPSTPRSTGFVAQDVEPHFPELVSEKDGLLALGYSGFGVIAIKAIQELHALVQTQQAELERQRAEIDSLKELVTGR